MIGSLLTYLPSLLQRRQETDHFRVPAPETTIEKAPDVTDRLKNLRSQINSRISISVPLDFVEAIMEKIAKILDEWAHNPAQAHAFVYSALVSLFNAPGQADDAGKTDAEANARTLAFVAVPCPL
ncbi:MAG: hypothetical protein HOO67_06460 [Candidatus Peribacteraceae bacterium]|nr:hypothetical protein [Candidatus Peribacteraceae bacterium]